MNLTITEKKENLLLSRQEVKGVLDFTGCTPSNKEVLEALSKQLSVAPELIVMKHIYNKFSKCQASLLAYVYFKVENKAKIERVMPHLKVKKPVVPAAAPEKGKKAKK